MRLIITDTNILFDIIKVGVLPEFFSLDYEICTTSFVVDEIKSSNQKEQVETFIRAKKLTVFEFSGEEIDEVINFQTDRYLKRFTDKTVVWKSHQLQCPMLTGDKKMREIGERLGIEVHGSIWVIDELIGSRLITNMQAIKLYEELMLINDWLPKNEIEKRINKLRVN